MKTIFKIRGCHNSLENFHRGTPYFVPDRWEIIRELNLNTITLRGGGYGNIFKINMIINENWANNLDSILSDMASHGLKTSFIQLATSYDTLLGIRYPDVPIDQAKAMIDELAGDNCLGHNFIADPRIWVWIVKDEPNLEDTNLRNWCIQVCDYIRGKGGKAGIAHPRIGSLGWYEGTMSKHVEPILSGHVDYLIYHLFRTAPFMENPTYEAFKAYQKDKIERYIEGKGSFSVNQIVLNEWGIWSGGGSGQGYTGDVTEAQREIYYRATFDAMKASGIINTSFYQLFDDKAPQNYGIVEIDGTKHPAFNVVKENYSIEAPPTPEVPLLQAIIAFLEGLVNDIQALLKKLGAI